MWASEAPSRRPGGWARLGRVGRRVVEAVLVAGLAVMAVLVFGNVVLRYAFNSGITLSEELSRLIFVWLVFLGAILAALEHAHIGVDLVVRRLPKAGKKACVALGGILMLIVCLMLAWGGWKQMRVNFDNLMPVAGLPYAVLYAAVFVGGLGLALAVVANLVLALVRPQSDDDLILVRGSEEEARDDAAVRSGSERGR
ncbi:MAG: TRAP transporter small permease [Rhodospirillales bacterium]|nr:TRAP transporter small permease [Rhodospirillales bacterium]